MNSVHLNLDKSAWASQNRDTTLSRNGQTISGLFEQLIQQSSATTFQPFDKGGEIESLQSFLSATAAPRVEVHDEMAPEAKDRDNFEASEPDEADDAAKDPVLKGDNQAMDGEESAHGDDPADAAPSSNQTTATPDKGAAAEASAPARAANVDTAAAGNGGLTDKAAGDQSGVPAEAAAGPAGPSTPASETGAQVSAKAPNSELIPSALAAATPAASAAAAPQSTKEPSSKVSAAGKTAAQTPAAGAAGPTTPGGQEQLLAKDPTGKVNGPAGNNGVPPSSNGPSASPGSGSGVQQVTVQQVNLQSQPYSSLTASSGVTIAQQTVDPNAQGETQAAVTDRGNLAKSGDGKPQLLAAKAEANSILANNAGAQNNGSSLTGQGGQGGQGTPLATGNTAQPQAAATPRGAFQLPPAGGDGPAGVSSPGTATTTLGAAATASGLATTANSGTSASGEAPRPAQPAPSPADQVAVQIKTAAGAGKDQISIKLNPAELGRIEVKMELGDDGLLRAVISAEKPETLELLQRDSRGLERALQDAGLKTDSQSLAFNKRGDGSPDQGDHPSSSRQTADRQHPEDPAVQDMSPAQRQLYDGQVDISV